MNTITKPTEMTNNKQQTAVKLYTEEEVRRAIELSDGRSTDEVFAGLTPIELPSDEEIEKESFDLYANHNTYSLNVRQYKAFKRGAKWMSNKIQGGEQ
jgi:predicted solute-binding protein